MSTRSKLTRSGMKYTVAELQFTAKKVWHENSMVCIQLRLFYIERQIVKPKPTVQLRETIKTPLADKRR